MSPEELDHLDGRVSNLSGRDGERVVARGADRHEAWITNAPTAVESRLIGKGCWRDGLPEEGGLFEITRWLLMVPLW